MISSRITTGIATLLVGGVALAALAPVLPFQEPAQPTQHHKTIVKGAGDWEGTFKYWMPGTPDPMEAVCSETVFALGELWTVSHFEMDFMGMPFSGSSTLGYDTAKKKFVGSWIDSSTTHLTPMEGTWDEEKKAVVMNYDMLDAMSGETVRIRMETVYGEDAYTTTSYAVGDEGEQKQMVIAMKRKKAVEAGVGR